MTADAPQIFHPQLLDLWGQFALPQSGARPPAITPAEWEIHQRLSLPMEMAEDDQLDAAEAAAKLLLEQAIALGSDARNRKHYIALALRGLIWFYQSVERYTEADEHTRRLVEHRRKTEDANSVLLAAAYTELAGTSFRTGNYPAVDDAAAKALLILDALITRTANLQLGKSGTARDWSDLASALEQLKSLADLYRLMDDVLQEEAIRRRVGVITLRCYPEDADKLAEVSYALANCLMRSGRLMQAMPAYRHALSHLDGWTKSPPAPTPEEEGDALPMLAFALTITNELADVLHNLGKADEAVATIKDAQQLEQRLPIDLRPGNAPATDAAPSGEITLDIDPGNGNGQY